MTYSEFFTQAQAIPAAERSQLDIRHDVKTGWYRAVGTWHGLGINTAARTFPALQRSVRELYGLCIPAKKDLIFSHQWKGRRHALLQSFLPGSAVVDVSGYFVR